MTGRERLIVALDVDTREKAERLVDLLSPEVDIFKVGIAPFTAFGEAILEKIKDNGKRCFLDLKFHDIPNTVANAARKAAEKNVFMMNFHCLGGKKMLEAAVSGAKKGSKKEKPLLLGVTVLTSICEEDVNALGLGVKLEDKVLELAGVARDTGLDGVVASAKEVRKIKEICGKDFVTVTPGIRPLWAAKGDQQRVFSPAEAISEGADYIVVGRPIVQAEDPLEAARKIIEEMNNGI